ncbi:MAG: hypothetical protein CL472_00965 [Acidobacteria bacterium]|nr:hypothetical protein [Acidobacteriota bacterium]
MGFRRLKRLFPALHNYQVAPVFWELKVLQKVSVISAQPVQTFQIAQVFCREPRSELEDRLLILGMRALGFPE